MLRIGEGLEGLARRGVLSINSTPNDDGPPPTSRTRPGGVFIKGVSAVGLFFEMSRIQE